ncbi:MAG: hypothetical protein R2828_06385 [Saprospiraceae bacterium]
MDLLNSSQQKIQDLWRQLWGNELHFPNNGALLLYIRVGIIIGIYFVVDRLLMHLSNLPLGCYEEPFIFWGMLRGAFGTWFVFPTVFLLVLAIVFHRQLSDQWMNIEGGRWLRLLITLAAGILAWSFATYDFNLYFNQGHYVDRILLLAFVLLIYWRPAFVLPFLLLLLPVIWQFTALIGYSWAAPFLLLRILVLFVTCFFLYVPIKRFPLNDFVFIVGILFAAHYWLSGWGKFNLDWIRYDQLFLVLPSAYANGWLSFLDAETIVSIVHFFSPFNGLMKAMVLGLEVGSVFFFFHRSLPRIFLGGWALFHIGILFFSGISFWMWTLMDLCLLWLFFRKDAFSQLPIFTKAHAFLAACLIFGGSYWCKPVQLSWYDLPFSYSYHIKALTITDEVIDLPLSFFAPYEYQFIMRGLAYLTSHPMLYVQEDDPTSPRRLMAIQSKEEFFELEKSEGWNSYEAEWAADFDLFIKRFLSNWNDRQNKRTYLSYLRAPGLLWNYPLRLPAGGPVPLKQITIFQITSLFSQGEYAEIRNIPIRTVNF